MFLIQNCPHSSVSTHIATEELVITLGLLNLAHFLLSCPVRAEGILSRGGSEIFFNLGEDRQNQFFPNIISIFPKFRGGLILRSSSVSPSLRMKLKHNQNFYILNSIHTRVKLKKNILSINRSCYIAKGKL